MKTSLFVILILILILLVLNELLPNQQYFLRVDLHIQDSPEAMIVMSDIISGITPPVTPTPERLDIRSIDVKLAVSDVDSTTAFISWKFFSFDEKQYIDGVQIRFTNLIEGSQAGIPGTTPFIHRDTNFFMLSELIPDTEYQVDLYLIPVPKSEIELISETKLTFKTLAPKEGML